MYRDGEFIKERRIRVAVEKRTTFGKEVAAAIWVDREWETLETLFAAGADVPKPLLRSDRAILMTYIGDEDDAAPQLRSYRPDPDEAEELLRQIFATSSCSSTGTSSTATSRRTTSWSGMGR